jgi:DNA polymerase-3 subunit delta'
MGFSEILGHAKQIQSFRSALRNGRLHHAYLFLGPEGIGKRTIALSVAKAIHCETGDGDFCGTCANCARINGANHPDLRVIGPLPDKKEISIQQVREIEHGLNLRSFSGKRKIAVIDPATLMNLSAQNALLKTLEEPPQGSLLILIASNAGGLLPTLRSRCLLLSFAPLERELVARFLNSKQRLDSERAELLAALAMGSIGTALALHDEARRDQRRGWSEIVCSLAPGNYRSAIEAAEDLAAKKDQCLQFLAWAETWYRDVLVFGVTRETRLIVNQDMLETLQEQASGAATEHAIGVMGRIAEAQRAIQRNLNRRMVLEQLFLEVAGES